MALRRVLSTAVRPVVGLCVVVGVAYVEGVRRATGRLGAVGVLVLVVLGGRLAVRVLRLPEGPSFTEARGRDRVDLELGLLAVAAAVVVAAHSPGDLSGNAFPLVYVAMAIVATFAARAVAMTTCLAAIALEYAIRALGGDAVVAPATFPHALVLGAFALLNAVFLRGRIDAIGARAKRRAEREVERMREQARSYRLHEGATGGLPAESVLGDGSVTPVVARAAHQAQRGRNARHANDPDRAARSGVEEIQVAVRFALDLLKRSLGAHTAILLFETPTSGSDDGRARGGGSLRVSEVVTEAPAIAEGPFAMGDGIFGAVARRRASVSLNGLRVGYRLPYYPQPVGPGGVGAVSAAPILEDGAVRGVLCVDRVGARGTGAASLAAVGEQPLAPDRDDATAPPSFDRPFTAHEEELIAAAARYILRAIENERVFGRLERAKGEQDHLYAAAQRLSGALTEGEVIEAGVESARAIASFDLAAITVVHEADAAPGATRVHEVRAVAGAADFEGLVGLRFGDNGGLVAQAVKCRHSLPHRGDHDAATQVVFTRRHPLRIEIPSEIDSETSTRSGEVRSVLVVPLILREQSLGTLVLGARRRGAFRDFSGISGSGAARTTLEVLASHIATSLANARMFAKLEELATTDGLTGLLNKRVLVELGAQKVRAAARYGKALAVIQTDIDHFKLVNDTHGHDVGDQVIKGLAAILRRLKRSTDYVARFGGEEFVIICEETDHGGALQLAERVREELARTTFHSSTGAFQVTCSLGAATFPQDGATWEALYKATDDALYASKRGGRNRTTVASRPAAGRFAG